MDKKKIKNQICCLPLVAALFAAGAATGFSQSMNTITLNSPRLAEAVLVHGSRVSAHTGVKTVASGFAGGTTPNPSYEDVCTGETGHAEVTQIEFDPQKSPTINCSIIFGMPTTRRP